MLKFYTDERARWAQLHDVAITDAWAQRALKKLARHFKTGPIAIRFAGRSTSWGGDNGITLAKSRDWLVFLHEFAHVWECRKHGTTSHHKRMARLVDRACIYALKMGWAEQDLSEQFEAFAAEQMAHEATEHYGREPDGPPVVIEALNRAAHRADRIETKAAHLARLERRIKGLTTRAKRLRRSLNALRRVPSPNTTG